MTGIVLMFATAAATWAKTRKKERARIEDTARAAIGDVIQTLRDQCDRSEKRSLAAEKRCDETDEKHKDCETRLANLERDKRRLAARIDKLMKAKTAPAVIRNPRPLKDKP